MHTNWLSPNRYKEVGALILVTMVVLGLAACGAGGAAPHGGPAPIGGNPTVTVQTRIGAKSMDRVLALQLDFQSITVKDSADATGYLLASPSNVEVAGIGGTTSVFSQYQVPPGTYTKLLVSLSGARVAFLDDTGAMVVQDVPIDPGAQQIAIDATPIVVADAPVVVNLTVDVNQTVTFDAGHTTATINPLVLTSVSQSAINPALPEGGRIERALGLVEQVDCLLIGPTPEVPDPCAGNLTQFMIQRGQSGALVSFNTDGQTQLTPGTLANVGAIMDTIVQVRGYTDPSGNLYAASVLSLSPSDSSDLQGVFGYSDTYGLVLIDQDGVGNGMQPDYVGRNIRLNLDSADGRVDLGDLAVDLNPATMCTDIGLCFDSSHFYPGQRVDLNADALTYIGDTEVAATSVSHIELVPQSITGTVQAYAQYPVDPGTQVSTGPGGATAYVDLAIPNDSYLQLLNPGVASVRVYLFAHSRVDASLTFATGQTVHARGLLYSPDLSDNYQPGTSLPPNFLMAAVSVKP